MENYDSYVTSLIGIKQDNDLYNNNYSWGIPDATPLIQKKQEEQKTYVEDRAKTVQQKALNNYIIIASCFGIIAYLILK